MVEQGHPQIRSEYIAEFINKKFLLTEDAKCYVCDLLLPLGVMICLEFYLCCLCVKWITLDRNKSKEIANNNVAINPHLPEDTDQ